MKKILKHLAIFVTVIMIVSVLGCSNKKENSSQAQLRVGMECAYAPFN